MQAFNEHEINLIEEYLKKNTVKNVGAGSGARSRWAFGGVEDEEAFVDASFDYDIKEELKEITGGF